MPLFSVAPTHWQAAQFSRERLHIVGVEEAVALRLGEGDEIGDGEGNAPDAENVGAEIGDLLLDVQVGALHQRHHGDQGSDPHGEAEDGQRRAELVGANGVHCQAMLSPRRSMDVRSDTSFA